MSYRFPRVPSPFVYPGLCLLTAIGLASFARCAGSIDDPARFDPALGQDPGSEITEEETPDNNGNVNLDPDNNGAAVCPPGTDVVTSIVVPSCAAGAGCHSGSFAPDLRAEVDYVATLVDVASTCDGIPLVDSADVANSVMLTKLSADPGPVCGTIMPPSGAMSDADIACLTDWVTGLVGD